MVGVESALCWRNYFQGAKNMPDSNKRASPEAGSESPGDHAKSRPVVHAEQPQHNHVGALNQDLTAELKRRLEITRLPENLRQQILAILPSQQEQERLYRELQENRGLSFEQFMQSLGLEVKPQS
jgi:hypothetical protein